MKLPAPEGTSVAVDLVPLATEARLPVASEPPGATVSSTAWLEGKTPTELVLDPAREHEVTVVGRRLRPPARPLWRPGPSRRGDLVRLEPAGPPGSVTIASSYPVDVSWRGRVLARGQVSPTVTRSRRTPDADRRRARRLPAPRPRSRRDRGGDGPRLGPGSRAG